MSMGQSIPEGLALMAPGPGLAAALDRIDVTAVSGFDVVEVMKARYRQLSYDHAKFVEAVVESGARSDRDFGCDPYPNEFAADEVRAALVLTRRAAEAVYWGGRDLLERIPAVHAALAAGELDVPRAHVFRDWTENLTVEQARGIIDLLLPEAGSLTTGQLIERIRRLALAVDPNWTRRQYDEAVAGRKVIAYTNPDGTATVEAQHLPVDRTAAIAAHLNRLARAARRAGDPRTMDQLRADLFSALTDGSTTGLDEEALITHVRADVTGQQSAAGQHDQDPAPQAADADPVASAASSDTEPAPAGTAPESPGADVLVRVRMSTLAGGDRFPGELAGMGPIHAELARDLVARMGAAQWRFALADPEGRLLHTGLITARPRGGSRHTGSRGVVELHVRECDLDALLVIGDGARWEPVLNELARKHRGWLADSGTGDDARRRTPGAALRRLLQTRDQTCFFVGCRAPATTAQIDHTVRYTDHGPTLEPNLGAGCVHDHRLKDEGGWTVTQPQPGRFHWTSRLGHHYQRHRRLIIEPMPEPLDRETPPAFLMLDTDHDPELVLANDLQRTTRPPPVPTPGPGHDDPPPF